LDKKVIIKIEVNNNFLSILILDNGEEFDLDEYEANNSKGYGLALIKTLADNINADLEIKAMPLCGTYRTLRVEI
jgi:signal transduction histidine kinase